LIIGGNSGSGTGVSCPNCRQPFSAPVEQLIDGGRDPQAKARLLSGRTNVAMCPYCNFQFRLATPIVYHDANKELLLIHVPMELNLPQQEQERIIGSMTNSVINSLPQDQRKGYLLMPKNALTMQGMLEMILEADGVTKEVMEARRAKVRLVESFLQSEPEQWADLAKQFDEKIDMEFFSILAATAENAMASGRRDVAESIMFLRDRLLELTTVGQKAIANAARQETMIQEVADALNGLGQSATQEDFVNLVLSLTTDGDDERLQVLVGLARPAMSYDFFQMLTTRADAAEGAEKERIEAVRDRLLELVGMVDQQNESIVRQAAETLGGIMSAPDMDEAIRERLEVIDDTFLAVLQANIQNAEQRRDLVTAGRLKKVFDRVMAILQESAPPVILFLNELMQRESGDEIRQLLIQNAPQFGADLLQWINVLAQNLAESGNRAALVKLDQIRQEAERVLGEMGDAQGGQAPLPFSPPAPSTPSESEPPAQQPKEGGIIIPFSSRKRKRD
jgi:hypothetical protein